MAQEEFSWSVQTHEHKEHSTDWYWGLGVITIGAAATCVYFGNTFLAAILVIGMGSIAVLVVRGPREHMVRIGKRGVSVDGTLYVWKNIHSFWIEHDKERPRLFLSTTGFLVPRITLTLNNDAQAHDVRTFLTRYIREEEQGPHMGEHLTELLGL